MFDWDPFNENFGEVPVGGGRVYEEDPYTESIGKLLTNDSLSRRISHGDSKSAIVKHVDFLTKENAREHHTDRFHLVQGELQTPIFRRGQPFTLEIRFKNPFKLNAENLRLDFALGPNPSPGKNTLIHIQVADSQNFSFPNNNWGVRVMSKTDTSLKLQVQSSANTPIGVWMLTVVTQPGKDAFQVPQHLYLLFNPWCKDDQVYMQNASLLEEYVLNDTGMIFAGESREILVKQWSFNHFFAVTVPSVMYILERAGVPHAHRGNPIEVSRALTRMGPNVLAGNWSGKYDDGISPMFWKTSNAILERYMAQKREVKWGQCWGYAGLMCTLCRAIGLPCRVVTCFKSAHDSERNLTLDRYYNMFDGKIQSGDSIWNFHAWNDVWMTRPDLPQGYGGWQAVDATPQEKDEKSDEFECGPASVLAIKRGEVGYIHNTMFIFSEVNADVMTWKKNFDDSFEKISVLEDECGKYVMTKAVGSDEAEDVTEQYKFAEGTQEERKAMYHAAKVSGNQRRFTESRTMTTDDDVHLDIVPLKSIMLGDTLQVTVEVENRSPKARTVELDLAAHSVTYNGVKFDEFNLSTVKESRHKKYKRTLELAPNQKEKVNVSISSSMYADHLTAMGYIKIIGSAVVKDTSQIWYQDETVMAKTPKLKVEMPEQLQKGKVNRVKLSFTNPLPTVLTGCSFSIAANCMLKTVGSKFRDVKANENVSHEMDITPDFIGPCVIMAQFNAKNLAEVLGTKSAKVV